MKSNQIYLFITNADLLVNSSNFIVQRCNKQTVIFSAQWKNKTVLVMNCIVKISLFSKRLSNTEHAIGLKRVRIAIEPSVHMKTLKNYFVCMTKQTGVTVFLCSFDRFNKRDEITPTEHLVWTLNPISSPEKGLTNAFLAISYTSISHFVSLMDRLH